MFDYKTKRECSNFQNYTLICRSSCLHSRSMMRVQCHFLLGAPVHRPRVCHAWHGRPSRLVCRASEEGIKDLLARDVKCASFIYSSLCSACHQHRRNDIPTVDVFADEPTPSTSQQQPEPAKNKRSKRRRPKSAAAAAVAASKARDTQSGPRTSREAIAAGLEAYQQQQYQQAVSLFEQALELPGSGSMRLAGTVREYACASQGEEHAALYNMACAYVAMGQNTAALTCVEGLLESGFEDFKTLRTDPDLAALRGSELDALVGKYDNLLAKVLGKKDKKEEGAVDAPSLPAFLKPW